MQEKNLFEVLGLAWGASDAQIREAYRRLAKQLHPDLNPNDHQAEEQFKDVAEAYWVLSDPERRKDYLFDHPHRAAEKHTSTTSGTTPSTSASSHNAKRTEPSDIHIRLFLMLEEIDAGAVKKIKIKRRVNCSSCGATGFAGGLAGGRCSACQGSGLVPDLTRKGGSRISCRTCSGTGIQPQSACSVCFGKGQVQDDQIIAVGIPAGAREDNELLIKGGGHQNKADGASGDLIVTVKTKDHPYLQRRGSDLIYHCSITLSQWISGCELKIPSLSGQVALKIPAQSKPVGNLRIRQRGLPKEHDGRGDLFVSYELSAPASLTRKQAALLQRLEETPGFGVDLDSDGYQSHRSNT
ncbi:MAG: J domain-containing protein [bacterium]|nr:J domain-containing protein [bacterium]